MVGINDKYKGPTMPQCPKCGTPVKMGYGLAGGGIGAYEYCPKCGIILEKWPDPELNDGMGRDTSGVRGTD
jgi:rRNA maturation protein Nop10